MVGRESMDNTHVQHDTRTMETGTRCPYPMLRYKACACWWGAEERFYASGYHDEIYPTSYQTTHDSGSHQW